VTRSNNRGQDAEDASLVAENSDAAEHGRGQRCELKVLSNIGPSSAKPSEAHEPGAPSERAARTKAASRTRSTGIPTSRAETSLENPCHISIGPRRRVEHNTGSDEYGQRERQERKGQPSDGAAAPSAAEAGNAGLRGPACQRHRRPE